VEAKRRTYQWKDWQSRYESLGLAVLQGFLANWESIIHELGIAVVTPLSDDQLLRSVK